MRRAEGEVLANAKERLRRGCESHWERRGEPIRGQPSIWGLGSEDRTVGKACWETGECSAGWLLGAEGAGERGPPSSTSSCVWLSGFLGSLLHWSSLSLSLSHECKREKELPISKALCGCSMAHFQ